MRQRYRKGESTNNNDVIDGSEKQNSSKAYADYLSAMKTAHHHEELHTIEGYTKLITSFGLLIPAFNGGFYASSHIFFYQHADSNMWLLSLLARTLNPLAWSILTLGKYSLHW